MNGPVSVKAFILLWNICSSTLPIASFGDGSPLPLLKKKTYEREILPQSFILLKASSSEIPLQTRTCVLHITPYRKWTSNFAPLSMFSYLRSNSHLPVGMSRFSKRAEHIYSEFETGASEFHIVKKISNLL